MCGITGWVSWRDDLKKQDAALRAMNQTMTCRGPDADGIWVTDHAALCHRRLAIIDLDGGKQPMASRAGDVVLTYSGEIYNFRELRAELDALGHAFRTRSDTEVVLHAYLEWGDAFVDRLNGMYAFAIWDQRQERLLLVRDRLGIKPLYYYLMDGGVVFGSEPKAILANPKVRAGIDQTGLAELLIFPGPRTTGEGIYRGMRELRPGHVFELTREGGVERRYWQLTSAPHTDTEGETIRTVRDYLDDITARQLISDVPLCSLLSGGVDSSAMTALAAKNLRASTGQTLDSFAVDFVDSDKITSSSTPEDTWWSSLDAPFAREVADHVQCNHTPIVLSNDLLIEHEDIGLHARDLPGWGDFDTSLYLLFKGVRERSTVALSGESADEVFGGYYYFQDPQALHHDGFPWLRDGMAFADLLHDSHIAKIKPQEYARQRYLETMAEVPRLEGETGTDARLREVFYMALTHWLPALLHRKDRASMAVGLEVRVPFCDHRLVEYVWNVPWHIKQMGGMEKGLLRHAVADALPKSVAWRKKSGYPAARDDKYLKHVRAQLAALLERPTEPVFDLLDRAKVAAMLDGTQPVPYIGTAPSPAHSMSYIVSLNKWIKNYGVDIDF
ncbi:asparagine synthase (glutamine-hydrolyzing) [Streptomyces sp. NPDC101150]|uniref:asparagine synthase (glutamine-hydrolyzing) n=1 Tax=Streptomyces sp. NPDC101150 TaxID=3366114 RepID=UPI00380DB5AF